MKIRLMLLAASALALTGCVLPAPHATAPTPVTVTWTNPTLNTDQSSIPGTGDGALTSARVEWGSCEGDAFGVKAGDVVKTMPVSMAQLELAPGDYCVQVKVTNSHANESVASNVAKKSVAGAPIVPCPPNALAGNQNGSIEQTQAGRTTGASLR